MKISDPPRVSGSGELGDGLAAFSRAQVGEVGVDFSASVQQNTQGGRGLTFLSSAYSMYIDKSVQELSDVFLSLALSGVRSTVSSPWPSLR